MPINELIRVALTQYGAFLSQAEMLCKQQDHSSDPTRQKHIESIETKLAILHCWLQLLNVDERFVIEKHVIDGLDWPRVSYAFAERWGQEFIRTERSLQRYHRNAMEKMRAFSDDHSDVILPLFSTEGDE